MGAGLSGRQAEQVRGSPELRQPLLQREATSYSCGSSDPVPPLSFKAGKPRKSQSFISLERQNSEQTPQQQVVVSTDVDPRLLEEASDTQQISSKVANLVYRYILEGSPEGEPIPGPVEDEFHEAHYLSSRLCKCWPRRTVYKPPASVEPVFDFINDISAALYFCKQVVVLCAVYIEKLLQQSKVKLTGGNWRSIVVVALLISSKVWEDVHPWNADFEECLFAVAGMQCQRGALYRLESIFLSRLKWQVYVDGEVYAAYFFSLLDSGRPVGCLQPRFRQRRNSECLDNIMQIHTIIEDEMFTHDEVYVSESTRGARRHERCSSVPNYADWSKTTSRSSRSSGTSTPSEDHSLLSLTKQELAEAWKSNAMKGLAGESDVNSLRFMRDTWKLDQKNPHIGSLRHAPRALGPSCHIPQSQELLWEHELAVKTADVFGNRRQVSSSVVTLSGATGKQLASELQMYLSGASKTSAADEDEPGELPQMGSTRSGARGGLDQLPQMGKTASGAARSSLDQLDFGCAASELPV